MAQPALSKLILEKLLQQETIRTDSAVLAICAGEFDRSLCELVGLTNTTLTNLDTARGTTQHGKTARQGPWHSADAHALPFDDDAFAVAFVSDGLHHCQRPHLALTEMCRVASRAIVVIESRDSTAMRAGSRLGFVRSYEINGRLLESRTHGGMNFGPIPNYVYRWTEREFEKTVRSFDPTKEWSFDFYHAMHVPPKSGLLPRIAAGAVRALAPRQGNAFGMVAYPGEQFDWLRETGDGLRIADDVTVASPPRRKPRRHLIRSADKWQGWPADQRGAARLAKE